MLGAYLEGNVGNRRDARIVTAFPHFDHDEPLIPEPSPESPVIALRLWRSNVTGDSQFADSSGTV